jgi:hypothetical protein
MREKGREEQIEEVIRKLTEVKSIRKVKVLPEEWKEQILELEEKVGEQVLMGLASADNEGVREALQRDVTLILLEGPGCELCKGQKTFYLMNQGDLAGEHVVDPAEIERLKKDPSVLFLSEDFVLYTDAFPRGEELTEKINKRELLCVFPPLKIPILEGLRGIRDCVLGWPSPPIDLFLKERISKGDTGDPMMGTYLLGFNL